MPDPSFGHYPRVSRALKIVLDQTSSNKTSEETIELNTEEEAAFLAESLTIKRQFDEINVIETQVADIAHLTQQISENIEEQAEIADEVHQNVGTKNFLIHVFLSVIWYRKLTSIVVFFSLGPFFLTR